MLILTDDTQWRGISPASLPDRFSRILVHVVFTSSESVVSDRFVGYLWEAFGGVCTPVGVLVGLTHLDALLSGNPTSSVLRKHVRVLPIRVGELGEAFTFFGGER